MVDLRSLFGPDDVIVPFRDPGGFNGGWITVADRLPGDTDGDWDVERIYLEYDCRQEREALMASDMPGKESRAELF